MRALWDIFYTLITQQMYQYCMLVSLKLTLVIKRLDLYIAGPDLVLLKILEGLPVSFLHSDLVGI